MLTVTPVVAAAATVVTCSGTRIYASLMCVQHREFYYD
jgi:hypothetical protein